MYYMIYTKYSTNLWAANIDASQLTSLSMAALAAITVSAM